MSRDLQSLKRAIARVTGGTDEEPGAPLLGTAFFVGEGYALSALHVITDTRQNPPKARTPIIWLDFTELGHRTKAVAVAEDPLNDWVILKCDKAPPVEPIECGPVPSEKGGWSTFGFPAIDRARQISDGTVTDPHARDPLAGDQLRVEAIQLYSKEAAGGMGEPMHGFSGAPCLAEGKAFGLLRTALTGTALDGQGNAQLLTQGGTVFACPASVIVRRGAPNDKVFIRNGWSLPQITSDFVVITSTHERTAEQRLIVVAENANEKIPDFNLGDPLKMDAEEQVASEESLLNAVRVLCLARVAVFDATEFEPAVMLLLGIRAAVRRGVTILSIGGNYVLGDRLDVPFNLLDANIVSHSQEQDQSGDEETMPIPLLAKRIERGLRRINSPYYFDLPVFEAVRRLPAERRGIRPPDSGVLVLCSFEADYTKKNWQQRLKKAFKNQLSTFRALRKDQPITEDEIGVARSFELNSPQLVSRAIYEEIRRAQVCVVDLTQWPRNVLFELGVRLAVSRHPTTCIVEKTRVLRENCTEQCKRLLALLEPQDYDLNKGYLDEPAFARMYGPKAVLPKSGPATGLIYECVEQQLQIDDEPASRPVYRELLDSSELFARLSIAGGVTKPVGLFPGSTRLTQLEENAEFERLLSAWLFMLYRFGEDTILQDKGSMRAAAEQAVDALLGRHAQRLASLPELQIPVTRMQTAFAKGGLKPEARLDEFLALKLRATALRKSGELELAQGTLDLVINGLKAIEIEKPDDKKFTARIRAELADTYGMRGGVKRRRNDLTSALADYKLGLESEERSAQSTYNLGNVITLSIILGEASPDDAAMKADIANAIQRLERQTQSSRGDEWWAFSDLGQFHLLQRDFASAQICYSRGRRTGPTREEYQRHIDVLVELTTAIDRGDHDFAQKLSSFIDALLMKLYSPRTQPRRASLISILAPRHEPILTADLAVDPNETSGEDTAVEELAKLLLHDAFGWPARKVSRFPAKTPYTGLSAGLRGR